jgi:bifunctional UDP-N-acetylglucosamine pyrophosphorylase / glucosamine-1-phosphate N-acetyltransferase
MSDTSTRSGVIVLAAGKGTRMKSRLPKVLHPVCGVPMVQHVIDVARTLEPERIAVVVGHGADDVRAACEAHDVVFVDQPELLGTADAVRRCQDALEGCDRVVVLNGDSPLIRPEMLDALVEAGRDAPMAFAVHPIEDRGGFGRVQRDEHGEVRGIVEGADGAGGIVERNAGQYVFDAKWLWQQLPRIEASDRGEFYLTALPAFANEAGHPARTVDVDPDDVLGVDTRLALAEAERVMRKRILERHMLNGVSMTDPATTYIDASVSIASDVTLLPNTCLWGSTCIGAGSRIGPGTTMRNAKAGEDCVIEASVIEDSRLGDRVTAGPYAHVRGNSTVAADCELGNYAEVNRSQIGPRVKMHHFSYVGDAEVGEGTNIAAGIVTCNYDGQGKHRTLIGRNVFLGSDTMLIAPITIGDNASTGAGSVVTKDVPPGGRVAGVPARAMPGRRQPEN